MNFLIFWDFSRFFRIIFAIFNVKSELKISKKSFNFAWDLRGCDVTGKAMWQRHAGPRGAYATRCDVCIIYISHIYIGYSTYKHPIVRI